MAGFEVTAEDLVDAADEWDRKNKDSSYLLQGARLAQAEEWLARHSDSSASVTQFVAAGRKARKERERRHLPTW